MAGKSKNVIRRETKKAVVTMQDGRARGGGREGGREGGRKGGEQKKVDQRRERGVGRRGEQRHKLVNGRHSI